MKKSLSILSTLLVFALLLIGCGAVGADDYPVPEELVISSEPGRESFEDQFGLKMGETGYLAEISHRTGISVTLNEVTILEEFQGSEESRNINDDRFFMIANVTVANFGENGISDYGLYYPVLTDVADAGVLEQGEKLKRDQLAGVGVEMYDFDTRINQEALHPGEEMTGDIVISVEEDLDSYLIWFGYQGYSNNITFEVSTSEAKRE